MGKIHEMGHTYKGVMNLREEKINENWITKSERMTPNLTLVEYGRNEYYDGLADVPSLDNTYKKAQELHHNLRGKRGHTRLMLQIHSYLYGEYRPELVERKNYDLIDYENKVMAEAGSISGVNAASRFARFLGFNVYDKNPEDWRMIHNPYGTDHFKIYTPTEKVFEALDKRAGAPYMKSSNNQ